MRLVVLQALFYRALNRLPRYLEQKTIENSRKPIGFFSKQELLGSSPQKKKERAWRDGWHTARELGAR